MARDTEKAATYERAGMADNRVGYGQKPAVLVVDLQRDLTDPESPLGADLTAEIEETNRVVDAARASEAPVVFTRIVSTHADDEDFGIWIEKIPTLEMHQPGTEWVEIDDRVDRRDDDHVLEKRHASSFHGTELDLMLTTWGVDTLVVTGCSTSGCVRATVTDACARGYRAVVPESCVGDRSPEQHEANLYDIEAKFGGVRATEEVERYLREHRST